MQARHRQDCAAQVRDPQQCGRPLRHPCERGDTDHFQHLLAIERVELRPDPEGQKAARFCLSLRCHALKSRGLLLQGICQGGYLLYRCREILGAACLLIGRCRSFSCGSACLLCGGGDLL